MKRLAILLAFLLPTTGSVSGCSWIFVQPLRDSYRPGDFADCTTNRAAPVIDTIFTLTNVGSAVYVAGENNVANKGAAVTVGLLVATLWLSSAIYGYSKTSDCEAAKDDEEARPRFRRSAPPVGYPNPAPPRPPGPATPTEPGQQQDEDDPSVRLQKPAPSPQKLDAPRYGG